jgi:AhpD family alkylhydroperoxidase
MTQRLNLLTAAPEGIAALVNVGGYIKASGLEPSLLALVMTRVSQINGCANCLHMHTHEAREAGVSEVKLHLLNAWRESGLYTARERAALDWAETLTRIAETHAPDEAYQDARFEFSEKELADLSIAIAVINAFNRLAIGARAEHPADRALAA